MRPMNVILLVSTLASIVIIAVSLILGIVNLWSLLAAPYYILVLLVGYSYLNFSYKKEQEEFEDSEREKQTFDYCWEKANEIMKRMPSGSALQWDRGFGRLSKVRWYKRDNKWYAYRAMLGYNENGQLGYVIYNKTTQDVDDYKFGNLTTQEVKDPFVDFKPFGETHIIKQNYTDRFGRRYPTRPLRFNLDKKDKNTADDTMVDDIISQEAI